MSTPTPEIAAAPSLVPDRLAALPRLGVGLSFQGALRDFALERLDAYDFLEITPDTLWLDRGAAIVGPGRYEENPDNTGFMAEVRRKKPVVCHSIGLSIGSAERFDRGHVEQVARWHERYDFTWHSDHLSFNRFEHASGPTIDLGVTLPVPYDEEVLDMIAGRVAAVQAQIGVPFLLENNVYYFDVPEQDMTEAEFLNRLTARTGCGLLLDLHNVYTNARNHGFDPWDFIGQLDLTRVAEIHLGGGMELGGMYVDAHSGPTPPAVWKLLAEVLPEAPNVCGLVFEVFGTYFPELGLERLMQELSTMREMLDRA